MEKFTIPYSKEDSSVTKSIRINKSLLKKLEDVSCEKNISVNKLIIECIKYALNNMEEDSNKVKN